MKSAFAMNTICVVTIIFSIIIGINGLEFKDCGSKVGKFTKVEVSDCDTTKSVCIFKRNTNASISIDFEYTGETDTCEKVNAVCHGIVMGIPMPFPLQNPNGCADSGISCPITKGTSYEYTTTLAVLKSYPKVKVDVKWQLQNENNEDIICVLIPAKIE